MEKLINREKGKTICIVSSCDIQATEYGICEGHRVLLDDSDLKTIICMNCDSIARIVEPSYVGMNGAFWRDNKRKKYIFCEVCRSCGATRDEETWSTYNKEKEKRFGDKGISESGKITPIV